MSQLIPDGWKPFKLEQLGIWGTGGTPTRKRPDYFQGSIPWIKTGELLGKYISETSEKITEEAVKNSNAKIFPANSIALAMYGATIGKVSILAVPASTNQACAVLTPNERLFSSEFVYYLLCNAKQSLVSLAKGGAQPNISQSIVKNLSVAIPPIDEQKRIVAKLDRMLARVDSCRAHLDRAAKAIKRFRQSVLNAAVTGNLLILDNNFKTIKIESEGHFKDYKLPEIPYNWIWAKFSDVAKVVTNLKSPYEYPEFPHIAPNHIESNTGRLLPISTVREDKVISPNHLFSAGSIIYSKIRPYLCKAVVVNFEGLCSADMYPITTSLNSKFLHMWLISSFFTRYASQNQSRVVLPKINQNALNKLPIPVPPPADQTKIVKEAEVMLSYADNLESRIGAARQRVDKLTASILAKAFRGELLCENVAKEARFVHTLEEE